MTRTRNRHSRLEKLESRKDLDEVVIVFTDDENPGKFYRENNRTNQAEEVTQEEIDRWDREHPTLIIVQYTDMDKIPGYSGDI